jgi:hypothetical protein
MFEKLDGVRIMNSKPTGAATYERARRLASQIFTSWNPLISWLRNIAAIQSAG